MRPSASIHTPTHAHTRIHAHTRTRTRTHAHIYARAHTISFLGPLESDGLTSSTDFLSPILYNVCVCVCVCLCVCVCVCVCVIDISFLGPLEGDGLKSSTNFLSPIFPGGSSGVGLPKKRSLLCYIALIHYLLQEQYYLITKHNLRRAFSSPLSSLGADPELVSHIGAI